MAGTNPLKNSSGAAEPKTNETALIKPSTVHSTHVHPPAPPPQKSLQTRRFGEPAPGEVPALSGFIKPAVIELLTMDQMIDLMELLTAEMRRRTERELHPEQTSQSSVAMLLPNIPTVDPSRLRPEDFKELPTRLAGRSDLDRKKLRFILFNEDGATPLAICALGDLVVGRSLDGTGCDLNLASLDINPPAISRVHALLRPSNDQLFLSDLDSTNGTFVGGERLQSGKVVTLKDGDIITFGKAHFKLRILPA